MEKFKGFVATIGTLITYIFGGWDTALGILITMIILDYITGILKAVVTKEVSSNVGLHGIARKALIFIVLIVAVLLDKLLNTGSWVFRTIVCYFYIANEGISILENCVILGLPIPQKIKDILIQLKDNSNKGQIDQE